MEDRVKRVDLDIRNGELSGNVDLENFAFFVEKSNDIVCAD